MIKLALLPNGRTSFMAVAQSGNTVTIHYTGKLEDGTVFDSSLERDPLSFVLGSGQVIPGFDNAVQGMNQGETKTQIIPCDQAYGPRNPEMIFRIDRQRIPPEMDVAVGQQLQFQSPTGEPVVAMVIEATAEAVTLDANHPHLANSAGTLVGPQFHYDLVRVGLALYGLYPAPHFQQAIALQPVMQVKARITQIKTLPAGSGVSYNHTFTTEQPLTVAVVGIGYADGVPRSLSNQMNVMIRGRLVPQIGAITMDQLMVDVSDVPNLQVGEVVTLLGQDGKASISAETWADILGTISYEIVCGFKHRLPRILVNSDIPQRL